MVSQAIIDQLEDKTGFKLDPASARSVGEGCIHEATLIDRSDGQRLFVKLNQGSALPLFEAEKASLRLLRSSGEVRVPEPYCFGSDNGIAFFAMEGLDLSSSASPKGHSRLGGQLSALHKIASPTGAFGADFDNFIGATPQSNRNHVDWADFYLEERLTPQFRLAEHRGKKFAKETELCSAVHAHLRSLSIKPVLLHGDLWGGNVGFLADEEPVIFDPACYFGDRETDMAFTTMFGGFSPAFYEAYRAVHPVPEPIRETIYNLYHLLNHFNLFGGGYAASSEASMDRILRVV